MLPARHRFDFALGVARQVTTSPLIFPWLRRQADHLASNTWCSWSTQARSDWSRGLAFSLGVPGRICLGATCSGTSYTGTWSNTCLDTSVFTTSTASLHVVIVVVDMVALAVPSYSGLSVDAELSCDIRTVTFTTCTLATTVDAVLNEFSGTYRFELRWL
jgi:hypothetical protein